MSTYASLDNMSKLYANQNERAMNYDVTSAFMIIYMIFSHITQWSHTTELPLSDFLSHLFYYFMPFFFFRGGVYCSIDLKSVYHNSKRRLLTPFVFFSLFGLLLEYIHLWITEQLTLVTMVLGPIKKILIFESFNGNLVLWFLMSLMVVRVLFAIIIKKISVNVVIVASALVSYLMCTFHVNTPLYFQNIPVGLMFFAIGYRIKDVQYSKSIIVTAVFLYISNFIFGFSIVGVRSNELVSGHYIHWIFTSTAGILLINYIFKRLECMRCLKKSFNIIASFGKNSMNYYVTHWLVIYSVNIIYNEIYSGNDYMTFFYILIASNIICLPIINKILKQRKIKFLVGA